MRKLLTNDNKSKENYDLYAANEEVVDENHPFLQRPETPKLTDEMKSVC